MVNILIHQFQPDGVVDDASALELFEDPTGFYRLFRYDR